jgi:hypothetical protein
MINRYSVFNESKQDENIYKPTNLIEELCTSMTLLNNTFLDNILDRGLRARYQENTHVFLNDLKNLLTTKNRLFLGKFENNRCIEDTEVSKLTKIFDSIKFAIDDDWNVLVDARNSARNIIDKLIPNEKLSQDMIKAIYWIGPNKDEEYQEDIVLELEDGRQFSFFLNKNITLYKTAAFNKFADELIGDEFEKLFGPGYIGKWNQLTRRWIEIIYENANKNIQAHIEKFIDPSKVSLIHYFLYFDIKHRDPRFKNLGEYIKELDDNFLEFSHLMASIWKNRELCFANPEKVYEEWMEEKVLVLNSRILEHILTEALTKNSMNDIEKGEDGYKLAKGKVKMKIVKTIVQKLGCRDRNMFFLGNGGNIFTMVPTIKFFREGYDNFEVKFDYHVELMVKKEERKNDFQIRMVIDMDGSPLLHCDVGVGFSRTGEMCGKLSARYKFGMESDFNERIYQKMKRPNENNENIQDEISKNI